MLTIKSIYFLMFTSGLLGGFGHCLGMCGPVVAAYSVTLKSKGYLPHILYNLGRISTYTLLGGIVGITGSFIGLAGHIQGVQKTVMIFAGALIIVMGLGLAGWLPRLDFFKGRELLSPRFVNRFRSFSSRELTAGALYPVGVMFGFIPCGLVYTALISAARAGMESDNYLFGFMEGVMLMLLFGLGTMPSLLLFGRLFNIISVKWRAGLYRLSAVVMIIMGIVFIATAV